MNKKSEHEKQRTKEICRQQKPKFSMDCKHQNFTEGTAWTKQIKLIKQKKHKFSKECKIPERLWDHCIKQTNHTQDHWN